MNSLEGDERSKAVKPFLILVILIALPNLIGYFDQQVDPVVYCFALPASLVYLVMCVAMAQALAPARPVIYAWAAMLGALLAYLIRIGFSGTPGVFLIGIDGVLVLLTWPIAWYVGMFLSRKD